MLVHFVKIGWLYSADATRCWFRGEDWDVLGSAACFVRMV